MSLQIYTFMPKERTISRGLEDARNFVLEHVGWLRPCNGLRKVTNQNPWSAVSERECNAQPKPASAHGLNLSCVTGRAAVLSVPFQLTFVTVVRTPTSEERCPLVRPRCPKEDLDAREADLAKSDVYDVVMKSLARMSGTDVADTVRRMLSFLIHHELAVTINWTGTCNKRAACDLLLMAVVQDDSQVNEEYSLPPPPSPPSPSRIPNGTSESRGQGQPECLPHNALHEDIMTKLDTPVESTISQPLCRPPSGFTTVDYKTVGIHRLR
ncbi:uncharacterized protein DEA37_0011653 [Paragonimus westermani]|uniref:DUF4806 domain-containing protein n=1 Tax=Paragonimus westermani TaxID=34504 RepID=A0A5J4NWG1_9TREM|nr:uncharacterized protein DEA37_0011653 [Paragonimus westermani]